MMNKQLEIVKLNSALAYKKLAFSLGANLAQNDTRNRAGQSVRSSEVGPIATITNTMTDSLRSNFSACCDYISAMQEHDLLLTLLASVDDAIIAKFKSIGNNASAERLIQAIRDRQSIEKKLERPLKDAEKKLLTLENTMDSKKRKIDNSEMEIQHRLILREQQLKQNKSHQMESSIHELDYLYKNDPQSLLEDTEKFAYSIKQDIERYKDSINNLTSQASKNQHLIDYYQSLKKAVGESK